MKRVMGSRERRCAPCAVSCAAWLKVYSVLLVMSGQARRLANGTYLTCSTVIRWREIRS